MAIFFTDKDVYSNPTSTTYVPPYNKIGSPKTFPNGMSVNVEEYKFTDSFFTYHNPQINPGFYQKYSPPEGAKYLWAYISVENIGYHPEHIPSVGDIYLSYKGRKYNSHYVGPYHWTQDKDKEIKAYPIYTAKKIYPDIERDGWIFFEIPQNFHPEDARIVIWGEKWRLS